MFNTVKLILINMNMMMIRCFPYVWLKYYFLNLRVELCLLCYCEESLQNIFTLPKYNPILSQ